MPRQNPKDDMEASAREYLLCRDRKKEVSLLKKFNLFDGDIDEFVNKLRKRNYPSCKSGWHLQKRFEVSSLAKKYKDLFLPVYIPPEYDPGKASGLLIFLHGGGRSSGKGVDVFNAGSANVVGNCQISDILENSGRIVCVPNALLDSKSYSRWSLPEVDGYFEDIIEELECSYNIDPDNIILAGQSMGGMGAIHMAHRFADRLASVFASGSCWDIAYWPSLVGSSIWLCHGINDAVMFKRRHTTAIDFARLAKQRLDEAGVESYYREHSGDHSIGNAGCRISYRDWLKWSNGRRRDPYYPHVVAVTPRGLTPWIDFYRYRTPRVASLNHVKFNGIADSPHSRWITIEETGDETIMFDMPVMSDCRDAMESDWNDFELKLKRKHIPGGIVEAFIREDNVIEVTLQNVKKFTLWLHPSMIDLNHLVVLVEGVQVFSGMLKPKLGTMLESYKRRRDWGLLYSAKITIDAGSIWKSSGDWLI